MPKPFEKSTEPKLVRVRAFTGPTAQLDADLARNILKAEGIPSVLPGGVMADVLLGVDVVQLLVREEDAQEAQEILDGYLDWRAS
jgi:putative signal transducing protein